MDYLEECLKEEREELNILDRKKENTMAHPPEPIIEINGNMLSEAEAMTVRVAIENFAIDLTSQGLGEDVYGKKLTESYLKQIRNVRKYIFSKGELK